MGTAQSWQRKRGDPVAGPVSVADAMLAEIAEEVPRLCLAHRLDRPEAPGRTRGLLDRLRAVREELSKIDLLPDDTREERRILVAVARRRRRTR